jgi:hypothetical protein
MTDRTGIELDAEAAYEAIRSINHATIFTGDGIPAPVAYRVLGFLQSAGGYGIAQALGQLARGLERSLSTYDVYEDDGRDPVDSVAHAVNALTDAVVLLQRVGPLLDTAQATIARQGYRTGVHDAG